MHRHFYVYKTGKLTVIGFDGRHLREPGGSEACRDELLRLVDSNACEVLVVDLMDVDIVSSWILGVLAVVRSKGVDVELYHPSAEVRDVLAVTHLDDLLHVRDDFSSPSDTWTSD
jgi:anti-anti-sigma factor